MTSAEKRAWLKNMEDPAFRQQLRAQLLEQLAQLDKLEEQLNDVEKNEEL